MRGGKFHACLATTHMKCVMYHRRRGCRTLLVGITPGMALAAADTKKSVNYVA